MIWSYPDLSAVSSSRLLRYSTVWSHREASGAWLGVSPGNQLILPPRNQHNTNVINEKTCVCMFVTSLCSNGWTNIVLIWFSGSWYLRLAHGLFPTLLKEGCFAAIIEFYFDISMVVLRSMFKSCPVLTEQTLPVRS